MAREVNTSDTFTAVPSSFDSTNSTYNSVYNNNNPTNGLTAHDSSTRACVYANTGASAVSDLWYDFDCSEIPSGATINSVSCQAGAACYSSGQYFATRTLQLYVGTSTAKGSATTITGNGSTRTNHTLTCGSSWSRSDLNSLKLRVHIVRTTSNTTTQASFSFWGATLTIAYTVSGYMYEITASSNVTGYTASPSSQEIFQEGSGEVRIDGSTLTGIVVKDNNIDVTNSLVRHNIETGGTISKTADSYTTSGSASNSTYFSYPVGYTAESPHTYSSNIYASSNGSTAYAIYSFDFSDIPSNATITSIEVKCSGRRENASVSSNYKAMIGLYSGTTLKSTEQEFTSTSDQVITISSPGTWTRTELQSAKLRFTVAYYGGRLYGITWNVTYTVPSSGNDYYWIYTISNIQADHVVVVTTSGGTTPTFYSKINGTWTAYTKAYIKVSGSWVQQSNLSSIFNSTTNYIKGN